MMGVRCRHNGVGECIRRTGSPQSDAANSGGLVRNKGNLESILAGATPRPNPKTIGQSASNCGPQTTSRRMNSPLRIVAEKNRHKSWTPLATWAKSMEKHELPNRRPSRDVFDSGPVASMNASKCGRSPPEDLRLDADIGGVGATQQIAPFRRSIGHCIIRRAIRAKAQWSRKLRGKQWNEFRGIKVLFIGRRRFI